MVYSPVIGRQASAECDGGSHRVRRRAPL